LLGALLAIMLPNSAAWAQALSGAYTINSAAPTAGTNFASFTAAAAALNTNGVSGPVTLTVSGGPYTEQISLNQLSGSSATNRVTINGGGRTLQFGSSTSAQRAVITLNGTDYVTINNLLVDATEGGTSTATYGWGIQLLNAADNVTISNCTVTSSLVSTSTVNFAGIVANNSATSPTGGGNAGSNLTVENNTIIGGYYGIKVVGNATNLLPGYRIQGNTVRDFHVYGIDLDYTTGAQVIGNEMHRPNRTALSTFYGVSLGTGNAGADVEKNRIHNPFDANPASTSGAYGIYVAGSDAPAGSENEVINNVVYNFNGSGTEYGLYNSSSDNIRYYHNTVNLDNAATATASDSYGFYQTTAATGIELRNNVLSVTRAGTGERYALYFATTTSTITSNHNDLHVGSGTNYFTGRFGSSTTTGLNFATLANWQTANNGAYDANSVQVDPAFVAAATGNLRPTAGSLNNAGTPLARVPQDITGATRGAAPDLGAYEFTPANNDAAVVSIDAPSGVITTTARTISVTILNNGGSPLTSVRLTYSLNGGAGVGQTFSGLNLASGASQTLTFTAPFTPVVGANTLTVTASLPNGSADANPANDAQTTTLYTALAGTFTINQSQPTGARNFASFADAATALNLAGVSAPVRLNVLNGPYTEQFVLNAIPGVSATDTVVIDGGASKQQLTYAGTSAQPGAVQLNGTDYLTLSNLTIDVSGGATYGIGVHLVGQAEHIRVSNSVVRGPAAATSSTANAGIAASGSVTSASSAGNANDLRVENNLISGGYYAVIVTGASTTSRNTGLRVTGNEIRDFYLYGLDVENQSGARLLGNNIHRSTRTGLSTFYGIYLIGSAAVVAENNRIHDNATGNTGSTSAAYGIYVSGDAPAGSETEIVNNVVYNFNGAGLEYGLYNTGADHVRYYHNTVSLDNAAATSASAAYGFYQTGAATGIDLRNNLLSVTRAGSGNRYALYFATVTSTITSDYNDLYVGSGANYFTGRFGSSTTTGLDFVTLANWKTANNGAYDQNSVQADPLFVNAATGNLQPTSVVLNGTGSPALLARVPRDIAGTTRVSPPDVGAYELSIVANDVAVESIDAPVSPAVLGVNPVQVTIRNGGTAVLNSVTLTYTLVGGGTPTTNAQVFTGLNLAAGATRQLSFATGITLTQIGTYTLTVTGSLPNGQADGNASNNSQTVTFDQQTPPNDEPCAAVSLASGNVTSSNANSTTSSVGGLGSSLPACTPSLAPKDVWFTWTPVGSAPTLSISGNAAGMVRIYSASSCTGPFTLAYCQASAGPNQSVGTVTPTGLTAGTVYYVAVSGYATGDATGSFTIVTTPVLGSHNPAKSARLAVYPNPSRTGQLTLRLPAATAGSVALLNALGQPVRQQPLSAALEQQISTRGLAAGVYTLRVQAGSEVLTRKVVLE
jgi:hypothetical protein